MPCSDDFESNNGADDARQEEDLEGGGVFGSSEHGINDSECCTYSCPDRIAGAHRDCLGGVSQARRC